MLPKYHILVGGIASILLYLLVHISFIEASIVFLVSVLIDVDHYFLYVFRTKDVSFNRAREYFYQRRNFLMLLTPHERKKYKKAIFLFHGIECWAIIAIVSYFYPIVLFVLVGIAIHIPLDYIDLFMIGDPFYGKFSQIYIFISNKKKESLIIKEKTSEYH